MKRILLGLGIIIQLAIGQTAMASTINFGDSVIHWDGYASSYVPFNTMDSINYPDYIGGSATIANDFLSRIDFTDDPSAHAQYAYNKWLSAGDLFIDVGADNTWDYLVNSWGKSYAAASVDLYDISALGITPDTADAYAYAMGNVRDNQPAGLKSLAGATNLGAVTWSGYYNGSDATNDYSIFFDFGNLAIDMGHKSFIIGYTETCGNDVVLEKVPVPEPGTMMLLGAGMLGLVFFGKRRMNKSA